jgi:hypothetical protein
MSEILVVGQFDVIGILKKIKRPSWAFIDVNLKDFFLCQKIGNGW